MNSAARSRPETRLRNYELISVLGHGGFGITYYARDITLGREVAIKEYLPTSLALRENGTTVVPRSTQLAEDFIWGRERFLEEARILATLEGVPGRSSASTTSSRPTAPRT